MSFCLDILIKCRFLDVFLYLNRFFQKKRTLFILEHFDGCEVYLQTTQPLQIYRFIGALKADNCDM